MRDLLRSLSLADRTKLVLEEPAFAQARLSGLSPETFDHALAAEMQRQFGPKINELNARERVVNEANAVAEIATSMVCKEAGPQFSDLELVSTSGRN